MSIELHHTIAQEQLITLMCPCIYNDFMKLYKMTVKNSGSNSLKRFMHECGKKHRENVSKELLDNINKDIQRITKRQFTLQNWVQIIRNKSTHNDNKDTMNFLTNCVQECARLFFMNPTLFNNAGDIIQKRREIRRIISDCIKKMSSFLVPINVLKLRNEELQAQGGGMTNKFDVLIHKMNEQNVLIQQLIKAMEKQKGKDNTIHPQNSGGYHQKSKVLTIQPKQESLSASSNPSFNDIIEEHKKRKYSAQSSASEKTKLNEYNEAPIVRNPILNDIHSEIPQQHIGDTDYCAH